MCIIAFFPTLNCVFLFLVGQPSAIRLLSPLLSLTSQWDIDLHKKAFTALPFSCSNAFPMVCRGLPNESDSDSFLELIQESHWAQDTHTKPIKTLCLANLQLPIVPIPPGISSDHIANQFYVEIIEPQHRQRTVYCVSAPTTHVDARKASVAPFCHVTLWRSTLSINPLSRLGHIPWNYLKQVVEFSEMLLQPRWLNVSIALSIIPLWFYAGWSYQLGNEQVNCECAREHLI